MMEGDFGLFPSLALSSLGRSLGVKKFVFYWDILYVFFFCAFLVFDREYLL